jgi:hypothetical protein
MVFDWKSFIRGIGSVINLFPAPVEPPVLSDEEALRSDWEKVGQDIRDILPD